MITTVYNDTIYPEGRSRLSLLSLVLELYYDAPIDCFRMIQIAVSKSFIPPWIHLLSPTPGRDDDKSQSSRLRLAQIYDFLAFRGGTEHVEHVRRDVDEKKKKCPLFRFFCKSTCSKMSFGF